MRKSLIVGLFLLAGASCLMGQENSIRWWPVVATAQSSNACWLVTSDKELESRMKELGWTAQSHDYPKIAWDKNIAAVITASDKYAKPRLVFPPTANQKVAIMLQADMSHPNSGILVVEIDAKDKSDGCIVEYVGAPIVEHTDTRAIPTKGGSSHTTRDQ